MKRLSLIVALAISSAVSFAQQSITQFVPSQLHFITPRGASINILKSPNMSSPVLHYGCIDETDDCGYMWSNAIKKGIVSEPYMFSSGDIYLTAGEQGNFYKIYAGNVNENVLAYVSKGSTKSCTLADINTDMLDRRFIYVKSGKYAGAIVNVVADYPNGWSFIESGAIVDNMIVFNHIMSGYIVHDESMDGIDYKVLDKDLNVVFGNKYQRNNPDSNDEFDQLDISKLSEEQIESFLTNIGFFDDPNICHIYAQGQEEFMSVYLNKIEKSSRKVVTQLGKEVSASSPDVPKADQMASYPGGMMALTSYISRHIQYPKEAEQRRIEGSVTVSFIIEKDGSLSDVKVINSVHPLLDAEAVRVVKTLPKWNPSIVKGNPVRTSYSLPVPFKILSANGIPD